MEGAKTGSLDPSIHHYHQNHPSFNVSLSIKIIIICRALVSHTFNRSTGEVKADGSL